MTGAPSVLRQIVSERSLVGLETTNRRDLADTIAVQLLRTKLLRTTMQAGAEQLVATLTDAGFAPEALNDLTLPTENDTRRAALETLLDRAGFTDALQAKLPVLIEPEGDPRFWTSDHPVVRTNSFPYGDVGLTSPGVEVYMPLTPDLMLGLLSPSIELKLRSARGQGLVLSDKAPLLALHGAILTGKPVPCNDATVDRFNRLQVSNSARFLYADRDNFDLAREILGARPELKRVTTQLHVGRLGEGPPRRTDMPDGVWLVLQGRSHHMLPLQAWKADAELIEASTYDCGTLAMAFADVPLVQVEIFESGQSRRMMREVAVELLASGPLARFRIAHSDPSLNQLMETIAARRKERSPQG